MVSDTNMWDIETPALATLLRGLLYTEIALRGPRTTCTPGCTAAPRPIR